MASADGVGKPPEPLPTLNDYFLDGCKNLRKDRLDKAAEQAFKALELLYQEKAKAQGRSRKMLGNAAREMERLERRLRTGNLKNRVISYEEKFRASEAAIRVYLKSKNRKVVLPEKSVLGEAENPGVCPLST